MKLEDLEIKNFYNYKIRSIIEDGVEMFFVTDLIRQYNQINGTNRQLKHYLENKQTREFINEFNEIFNAGKGPRENSVKKYLNIKHVIEYVNFSNGLSLNIVHGYLMREEVLNSCLFWLDPKFAARVCIFLKKCRHEDNQYLDNQDEFLKSRAVMPQESQDWSFMVSPVVKDNEVVLKASYCRTKNITKKQFLNPKTIMIHGLPNGYTFKYFVFVNLKPVIKSYHGNIKGCHRSMYTIPKHAYDDKYETIVCDIEHAIIKTRIMLHWSVDWTCEDCSIILNKLISKNINLCTNINMSLDSYLLIKNLFRSELSN